MRRVILVAAFNPSITLWTFDDLERGHFFIFLRGRVGVETTDQALDGIIGKIGVGYALAPRGHADQALIVFVKGHNRWRCALAFGVLDDFGGSALHHSNT